MEALDISASNKLLSNLLPVLALKLLDGLSKHFVLLLSPVALVAFTFLVLRRPDSVDAWIGQVELLYHFSQFRPRFNLLL